MAFVRILYRGVSAVRPVTARKRAMPAAAAGILACVLVLTVAARESFAQPVENRDDSAAESLREILDELQTTGNVEVENARLLSRNALPAIYSEGGYRLFWTPERLTTLLELVRDSAGDGLLPEDYHLSALERLASSGAMAGKDAAARARGDLLATDSFYLLLYHLYVGKVDPKSFHPQWNFDARPIQEPGGIRSVLDVLTQGRLREAVKQVRPDHWWYERGRAALAAYRNIAARGGWPSIPQGKALKSGMKDKRIPALRQRLAATGELSGESLDSEEFDEPLVKAVAAFQTTNRLNADGAVGAGMLKELNVPVETRIRQIRINLERGRWALHELGPGTLVIVDIAGFDVLYMQGGAVVWRSRIQVGKPYRETPIFKSKIDHIVFNPTWTVPPGIFAKDTLPAIKKDPSYLEKKRLDVIDSKGNKIDASQIDWSRQTASNFRYMLRQEPGKDNALGQVKIMFPNPYLVYLHDTPSKALFEKDERAFSSGCMRVQRPLELAKLLLNDEQNWNTQSIDKVLAAGQTKTVLLRQQVPVLIMYWTIDLSAEGRVGFKRDPYNRDPKLAAALDAPFSAGQRRAP
jgi:murein L,D-transpeptidase YcbB/YkuD